MPPPPAAGGGGSCGVALISVVFRISTDVFETAVIVLGAFVVVVNSALFL